MPLATSIMLQATAGWRWTSPSSCSWLVCSTPVVISVHHGFACSMRVLVAELLIGWSRHLKRSTINSRPCLKFIRVCLSCSTALLRQSAFWGTSAHVQLLHSTSMIQHLDCCERLYLYKCKDSLALCPFPSNLWPLPGTDLCRCHVQGIAAGTMLGGVRFFSSGLPRSVLQHGQPGHSS